MPRVYAQQPGKLYRIAIVHPSAPVAEMIDSGSPRFSALFKELRRLGYVEGQNVVVERYSGAGRAEHYPEGQRSSSPQAGSDPHHRPHGAELHGRYDCHHEWRASGWEFRS
jgi:hypothetical protein